MPRRTIVHVDTLPPTSRRWDDSIAAVLVAMLVFMPASFGAVEAWSQLLAMSGAAVLAVALALRTLFDRNFRVAAHWTYVPLALLMAFVALQVLPLPLGLAGLLSPTVVSTKEEFLGNAFSTLGATTLSVYPRATAEMLWLLFVGATVFVTVATVFRSRRQVTLLLTAIFVIGCAEAFLALVQSAAGAEQIYWKVPAPSQGVVSSGSFINRSHFCQFMNLSIGAGIALLLVQLRERQRQSSDPGDWSHSVGRINWEKQGWILVGLVMSAIAVCGSMSRNGAISLVIASGVVGIALFRRGALKWQGWLLGAVPLSVLVTLLLFGFDRVFDRLATLQQTESYASRWELVATTLRVWRAFPVFGAGLGAHEFIFPLFDTSVTPVMAAHADNDYVQLLEEVGIVGTALIGMFLVGILVVAVRLAFRGRGTAAVASFGIAFGLVAVMIHSASDFGQRIPANFSLSAAMCGLLVSIAGLEEHSHSTRHRKSATTRAGASRRPRAVAVVAVVGLLAAWSWALYGAYSAYLGERWWSASYVLAEEIQQADDQGSDEDYIDLLTAAERAAAADPGNVMYGYWLAYYRWESMSRNVNPEQNQTTLPRESLQVVSRIADDLAGVRVVCPTYGPPYALEGQLRLNVLGEPSGADLIRKGFRLSPYDPPTCLVAGELAAREGNVEEAKRLLSRAVLLQPAYYGDVINICLSELKRPDLARELAGDDHARLEALAATCAASEAYAELAPGFRAEAEANLRRVTASDDASARELAAVAELDFSRRDFTSAIELYRRALTKEYRQLNWRIQLARALAETGHTDDGIYELRICLRLQQNHPEAQRLLDELSAKAAHLPR